MRIRVKRLLAIVLTVAMVVSQGVMAAGYSDTGDHWAGPEIDKWSDAGLLQGYEGMFMPGDAISRAEMAVMIDRLMGYQMAADNTYTDLEETWYTEAVLKNTYAGVMKGYDKQVRPADSITRQEAVVMLSRAMEISEVDGETAFTDDGSVADWAKGYVKAFSDMAYINGMPDGSFAPEASITRAEVVAVIDNMLAGWIIDAGDYTDNYDGTVIIKAEDVTLEDAVINGDLIITEGVGEGEVHLANVTVTGNTVVKGGGENSVYFDDCELNELTLAKEDGKIRIVVSGSTSIKLTRSESGALLVERQLTGGGFEQIEVPADALAGSVITIEGSCDGIDVNADEITVIVDEDAKIGQVNLQGIDDKLIVQGQVGTVAVEEGANNAEIIGEGKVETTETRAPGTIVLTENTKVTIEGEGSVTDEDGNEADDGDRVNVPTASSGGGGGGGSTTPANNAPTLVNQVPNQQGTVGVAFSYNVPGNTFADEDGDTLTLTADVTPAGITFDNGVFSGNPTSPRTTTVTITASDGNGGSVQEVLEIAISNNLPVQGTKVKFEAGAWVEDNAGGTHIGIWSAEDLQLIHTSTGGTVYDTNADGSYLDEDYVLMADIDFEEDICYRDAGNMTGFTSGEGFTPIGYGTDEFTGTFNGDGKIIENLYIDLEDNYIGLFASVTNGEIEDLDLAHVDVTGDYRTGGLVGAAFNSTVSDINVTGDVEGRYQTGGLIGYIEGATVDNCQSSANLIGGNSSYTGGLVGECNTSTVTDCSADGTITSEGNFVGGLIGTVYAGTVEDSYAAGDVTGKYIVGGFAGQNSNNSTMRNCYATGDVTTTYNGHAGGFVGSNTNGSLIDKCYTTGAVTSTSGDEDSYVGGFAGINLGTDATIQNSFASGDVNGGYSVGGFTGGNGGAGKIYDCYATGDVSGSKLNVNIGGFTGMNYNSSRIENCYSTGDVTGDTKIGGFVGYQFSSSYIGDSFAFNFNVTGTEDVGRFAGASENSSSSANYANDGMTISETGSSYITGANRSVLNDTGSSPLDEWESNWSSGTNWELKTGADRPTLIGVGNDDGMLDGMEANGSATYPFEVATIEDLAKIGTGTDGWDLDKHYVLMNDLDFEEASDYASGSVNGGFTADSGWQPIGDNNTAFSGSFDGDGYAISNLYISRPTTSYIGLFGKCDGAELVDIGLIDCNIIGDDYVGGLVGDAESSTITDCYTTGVIQYGGRIKQFAGGLTGRAYYTDISDCYSELDVGGYEYVGGLVGYLYHSSLLKSFASGEVTGGEGEVGGIVGYSYYGTVENTYSTGDVSGAGDYIGGLIGRTYYSLVSKSYTTGDITFTGSETYRRLGGITGMVTDLEISDLVAYNSSISYEGGSNIGRITGRAETAALTNNYAYADMLVNGNTVNEGLATSGNDLQASEFNSSATYEDGGKLSSWAIEGEQGAIWEIRTGADRPTLIGVGNDDGAIPDTAAPTVANPIDDIVTTTGSAITVIDLDNVFDDASPMTYSITSGTLPTGITLSGSTISGTPTTTTSALGVDIEVTAEDTSGNTATDTFNIKVVASTLIYYSDFEDEATGTIPDGWTSLWSGTKSVVDTAAYSGSKSLKLTGASAAAAGLSRDINLSGIDRLVVTANVKGDVGSTDDIGSILLKSGGTYSNRVSFYDYKIYFNTTNTRTGTELEDISLDTWYKISIIYDFANDTVDIYINDVLKGDRLSMGGSGFDGLVLTSGNLTGANTIYFDNIRITSY